MEIIDKHSTDCVHLVVEEEKGIWVHSRWDVKLLMTSTKVLELANSLLNTDAVLGNGLVEPADN